ncbi:NAC domain-containing protein 54-like [Carex rostrata]
MISENPVPQQQMKIFLNAIRDLSRIPSGFGFNPTDRELLCYYLKRKINSENCKDMDDIIPEVDVFDFEPMDLSGKHKVLTKESKWYFFKPDSHHYKTKEWGIWEIEQNPYPIKHSGEVLGRKKKLIFCVYEGGKRIETSWRMYEYYLDGSQCKVGQKKDRFSLVVLEENTVPTEKASQLVDRMTGQSSDPALNVGCIEAAPEPRPYALSEGPEDGIPSLIPEEDKNRSTKEESSSLEMTNFAPKDGQVGQSENSKKMKGKEVTEDKSVMTKRAKTEHGGRSLDQS